MYQSGSVFTHLFQLLLDTQFVPRLWRLSTIIPVPKKRSTTLMKDFKQTCCIKICIVQIHGKSTLSAHNSRGRSHGSSVICIQGGGWTSTLLDTVSKHLDSTGNFVRILFMDFSSAFNTIQPHLLIQRQLDLRVNPTLVLWVRAFLCDRPQCVCVRVDPLSVQTCGSVQSCLMVQLCLRNLF